MSGHVRGKSITALFGLLLLVGWPMPTLGAGQQPNTTPTLTILPFTNVTGDPADDWIGEGIAEAATADLGTLEGLAVISRETILEALQALGAAPRARIDDGVALSVGRQVGATWLISGSYQHAGGIIRVTAQLVDVATGSVLEAAKVDGVEGDVFGLQDRLGQDLRRGVEALIEGGAPEPPAPPRERPEQRSPETVPMPPEAEAEEDEAATPPVDRVPVGQPEGGAEPRETAAVPPTPAPPARVPDAAAVRAVPGAVIDDPPAPEAPAVIARDEEGRVTVRAVRIDVPMVLDGRLDEAVYQTVPSISDFIQQDPNEGAPATEKTEAWILFDDRNLYVSARCWDSQPERMIANEMRRDGQVMQNENFAVLLDTFYDRRNGFLFHVNPLGGMFDADVRPTMNRDWNGVWDVKTGRFDGGWTVEIVIPFKSLRYRRGESPVWGINLRRIVRWKNELSYLTPVPASFGLGAIAQPSRGGTLVGLEMPGAARNIEIKPYVISDLTTNRTTTPAIDNAFGKDAGFDLKYGVTESLTADLTYNTDFAQVEADEQQVNLTRFSLFFPEKREFFLEGQGIFEFGGVRSFGGGGGGGGGLTPVLFFSRRIGLSQGQVVPIDAGGRLTGKAGPFTVGVLHIQTAAEATAGASPTAFDVVRVKRDILRRSSIGALFTRRSVSDVGTGVGATYGVDGAFSFDDRLTINTSLARTETPGLTGNDLSYRANLNYNSDRYGLEAERLVVEDHFNPQVGFVRRDDIRRSFGSVRFSPRPSAAAIRKLSWQGSLDHITNNAGRLETRTIEGRFGIDLDNSDRFQTGYTRTYDFLAAPFGISSGVTIPIGGYDFDDWDLSYTFGQQRKVAGTVSVSRGSFYDGEKTSASLRSGRVEISPRLSVEPGLSFDWVDLPQGSFKTRLVNARTTFTATPRMYVGALVQYNAGSGSINSNVRLRWEYVPGSEFFVVYTEERDSLVPRFPALENRALVIKVNRLFRF